jgi:hypothetical protein
MIKVDGHYISRRYVSPPMESDPNRYDHPLMTKAKERVLGLRTITAIDDFLEIVLVPERRWR